MKSSIKSPSGQNTIGVIIGEQAHLKLMLIIRKIEQFNKHIASDIDSNIFSLQMAVGLNDIHAPRYLK